MCEYRLIGYSDAELNDVHHHLSTVVCALFYVRRCIRIRLVHRAEPSLYRSWFLDVDAHHDLYLVAYLVGKFLEALRVLNDRLLWPRGARTDNEEKPFVSAGNDVVDLCAILLDARYGLFGERVARDDVLDGRQLFYDREIQVHVRGS